MKEGGKIKTTIVIRSMNDGPQIVRRCLTAVKSQEGVDFELLHIDSGSRDGTLEVIREFGGRLYHIRPAEYIPGRVLNFAMELCSSDIVVFLNADAVPVGRNWLRELVEPFSASEKTAAVFSRQLAREDADALFVNDNERAFGDGSEHSGWRHFFSMASSAIKRSYWQSCHFSESLRYSEDIDWTYRLRLAGAEIAYAPKSLAVHSHNYTLRQSYRRHFGEGLADAHIYKIGTLEASFGRQVLLAGLRESLRDLRYAAGERKPALLTKSPLLRGAQRIGHYAGLRQGLKHQGAPAFVGTPDISAPTLGRYTIAYEPELEARLDADFERIAAVIKALQPAPLALVLGGGYGRREGGVFEIEGRKAPYNDYDFYAVYDTMLPRIGARTRSALSEAAHALGRELGIDVDIAPISLSKLRRVPARIEWYELKRGHLVIFGPPRLLDAMPEMHGAEIPADEGERLLMNRSVGLILARRRLSALKEDGDIADFGEIDFITRNIYKAALAAGDVLLLRNGLYHYSYRERARRMNNLQGGPLALPRIKTMYADAVRFRSKPFFNCRSKAELQELWLEGLAVIEAAARWFIHSVRGTSNWKAYSESLLSGAECSSPLNAVKTIKTFGLSAASSACVAVHPQMRIRAAVPVLLYGAESDGAGKAAPLLDMLAEALLMPACASSRRIDIDAFMRAAEARMLDIWREVN